MNTSAVELEAPVQPNALEGEQLQEGAAVNTQEVFNFKDARLFVKSPAPLEQHVYCHIERKDPSAGIYHMYLESHDANTRRFLMASKKLSTGKAANYILTLDKTDHGSRPPDPATIVASLKSNFVGTSFTAMDVPADPTDAPLAEIASITYEANILGMKGPRKMTVLVPGMTSDGHRLICRPANDNDTMAARYRSGTSCADIIPLSNKPPHWNEALQSFTLDFHGRVTQASVKNFQLVHEDDVEYIVMQMGKVREDVFTVDYQYPLCAHQVFATALSSFHGKLACE